MQQEQSHEDELAEFENKTCPTCGSCSGMYTANSMNCLTEVLGMGLKGNGTIPAVYSEESVLQNMQVCRLWNCKEEHPSERHYDKRGNSECTDSRHGTWMLHKQYASSSGYRS